MDARAIEVSMPVRAFPDRAIHSEDMSVQPVGLRLIADFTLAPDDTEKLLNSPTLIPQQQRLIRAALRSASAWKRLCRMAFVSELEGDPSRWYEGLFRGPDMDQILDAVLAELTPADQSWWAGLRDTEPDALGFYLEPLFQEISSVLVSVKIVDLDTGESVPAVFARQDA